MNVQNHVSQSFQSAPVSDRSYQLVARIKRSSKYWGQTAPNAWFVVEKIVSDWYQLRGNNNNYRIADVACGVRLKNGTILDLTTGKEHRRPPAGSRQ